MHPSIGQLSNGRFYSYVNSYAKEPFEGTLEEVEVALGLRAPQEPALAGEKVAPVESAPQQKPAPTSKTESYL